jgi:hypothetical protein
MAHMTNGDKVNVRSYSTHAGKPTLEIQHNNGQVTKIRYDN